jgi:uncharacterized membrane protein
MDPVYIPLLSAAAVAVTGKRSGQSLSSTRGKNMNTLIRFMPWPGPRWVGVVALLLGSSAAAVPPSSQTAGVAPATEQAISQAEAQAARFDVQSGEPASCSRKHQHGLRYSVQTLEVPGGNFEAFPTAINNRGWVVGYSSGLSGVLATLWIGGRAFDLGGLGSVSYAYDINDAGRIVGFSSGGNGIMRATTWYRGHLTVLPSLSNTATQSVARGINRSGTIAGESAASNANAVRAVIWSKGIPHALDSLGGSLGSANRVNDLGYSVGSANVVDATLHAALWNPRGDIVDLGAQAVALDINNGGRIVGYTFTGVLPKPAKWYRGVRTVLPTLGGENGVVYGINEKDEAVGYSQTATGLERATIWFGNKPVELDTLLDDDNSGTVIDAAYAINDKGQIAAIRRLANNRVQPVLLTPHHCHAR